MGICGAVRHCTYYCNHVFYTLFTFICSIYSSGLIAGTFGDVEHVFLVGVCGAVPHYTDYYNHVRLGDIVVSMPNKMGQLYIYCDKTQSDAQRSKIQ